MHTVKLVVLCAELHYAGVTHFRGETFSASLNDSKVLKLVGRAEDAPAESAGPMGLVDSTVAPVAPVAPAAPAAPVEPAAQDLEPEHKALAAADEKPPAAASARQTYRTRRVTAKG